MQPGAATTSPWIRTFHHGERPAARLVCLPHAGGSASFYHPLSLRLAPAVQVLAVQYPGRQDRSAEPFVTDVAEVVDHLVSALHPCTEVPLALFGHSVGATIAFELARRLESLGAGPAALFASGRMAPPLVRDDRTYDLPDRVLIEQLRRLDGPAVHLLDDPAIAAMFLPIVRNDYRMAETYRFVEGVALSCPIVALTADADPCVAVGEVAAWRAHTTGGFELLVLPGGHFFVAEWSAVEVAVRRHLPTSHGRDVQRPN